MMFQFLTEITHKRVPKQQQSHQQSSSDNERVGKSSRHDHHRQYRPDDQVVRSMARSASFHSIQSTTSASWLDEKHEFSFKNDYVSFPSLDIEPTDCL
ncbi:hypothetical protein [Absidia glauca]|uniref:Uncharacterized protein n=1 Tax=Absidia glauca TaxID=4829 RepID=A0A163JG40_ABSGL|nr:hypothetical protein [Absidia glauca]